MSAACLVWVGALAAAATQAGPVPGVFREGLGEPERWQGCLEVVQVQGSIRKVVPAVENILLPTVTVRILRVPDLVFPLRAAPIPIHPRH